MTGFLRKKTKHAPPPQPESTSDAVPTPLFSRFASKTQEPQRAVVSSPMVLSSTRSQNRGSRVITHRDGGPTPQRRPGSTAMKSQETVNSFGKEPRARATVQKKLPRSAAASTSYLPSYDSHSPDVSVGAEYAHLWSVIAGNATDHHQAPTIPEDTASATHISSPHPTPQHTPPPNMSPLAQKTPASVLVPQPPLSFSSPITISVRSSR